MARSASHQVAKSPTAPRVKMSFSLTPKTARQVGAACVAEGMSQSEIAEMLFSRYLSGYFVGNRGASVAERHPDGPAGRAGPVTNDDRRDAAVEISLPAESAA
jgi:hypothetical protein